MNITLHKSETRGNSNIGWLESYHTYSFARYYNPERMGFGKLRVLNDDLVQGGFGFDTHPHRDMEIISFPLSGSMKHVDSSGHEQIVEAEEVQIMSAGTGVAHSEYNASTIDPLAFLQIWIKPSQLNLKPSYDQRRFDERLFKDQIQLVISPEGKGGVLKINQDCQCSRADLSKGCQVEYPLYGSAEERGVYIFVLDGSIRLGDLQLSRRDGAEVTGTRHITLQALAASKLLLIETPL